MYFHYTNCCYYEKNIFTLTTLAVFTACKSDDEAPDPGNYQTPLPAATQTGKRIFACYVDGKAYITKSNEITSYYQYVDGNHSFIVSGAKEIKPIFSVKIGSTNNGLTESNTYILEERIDGKAWGGII